MRNDTNNNNNMTKDTLESSFVLEFFIRERETSLIFRVSKRRCIFFLFSFVGLGRKHSLQDVRHIIMFGFCPVC